MIGDIDGCFTAFPENFQSPVDGTVAPSMAPASGTGEPFISFPPMIPLNAVQPVQPQEDDKKEDETKDEEGSDDDDEEVMTEEERKKKKELGRVWMSRAKLLKMTQSELVAREWRLRKIMTLTPEQEEELRRQKKTVKNRVGAARRQERFRETMKENERLTKENRDLRNRLTCMAELERENQELRARVANLETENQALHAQLSRFGTFCPAPVLVASGTTTLPTAPVQLTVVQPSVVAPPPVMPTTLYAPGTYPVPLNNTGTGRGRRGRLRTPALLFLSVLVLILLVSRIIVLEARTNPTFAHKFARAFDIPDADDADDEIEEEMEDTLVHHWSLAMEIPDTVVHDVVCPFTTNITFAEDSTSGQCCLGKDELRCCLRDTSVLQEHTFAH